MSRAALKKTYLIFRSVVFSLLLTIASLYILLYISLSLPPVQKWIKGQIEKEFNRKSSGRLEIGELEFSPFSEVRLNDVRFISPSGEKVVTAQTVGAGINMWKLVFQQKVQLTYAELISLDAKIIQEKENGPLNIQFIIDGFKSSNEKNEPTRFDLALNNIVIRNAHITFDRAWKPYNQNKEQIDFNHLNLSNISADLRLPRLRNDDIIIDLRRLSFSEAHGLDVQSISLKAHVTNKELSFNNLEIRLPGSELHPNDMTLRYDGYNDILAAIKRDPMQVILKDNLITPSDFRAFVPALKHYSIPYRLTADLLKTGSNIQVNELTFDNSESFNLSMNGLIASVLEPKSSDFAIELPSISFKVTGEEMAKVIEDFSPLSSNINQMITSLGDIDLGLSLKASLKEVTAQGYINTSLGNLTLGANASGLNTTLQSIRGTISTSPFEVGSMIAGSPLQKIQVNAQLDINLSGKEVNGTLEAAVPSLTLNGAEYQNLYVNAEKRGNEITGDAFIHDLGLDFNLKADLLIAGAASHYVVETEINELDFSRLNIKGLDAAQFAGVLTADVTGNSIDNVRGIVEGYDLRWSSPKTGDWHMNNLSIESRREELPYSLDIDCDWGSLHAGGDFEVSKIPAAFMYLLSAPLPTLIPEKYHSFNIDQNCQLALTVFKDSELTRRLKLPVSLLEDLRVDADFNTDTEQASLRINVPYLQMGKDKLIRNTALNFTLDNPQQVCNLSLTTTLPGEKGATTVMIESDATDDTINTDLSWIMDRSSDYKGLLDFTTSFDRTKRSSSPDIHIDVNPGNFVVNDTVWEVSKGVIEYADRKVTVEDVTISRQGQSVSLFGSVSDSPHDVLDVDLQSINLDYIFETLNINYVVFGGDATGTIHASELFSKHPHLYTEDLFVRDLTYNHALMGDAYIKSRLDTQQNAIRIKAKIDRDDKEVATVDGGIWLAKDSLAFDFGARDLEVKFLKPFVAAFCDDITGHASGNAKLYGTFKDINLTGKVYAHSVGMLIGVTNTVYTASDSVLLTPGKIHLDNITLHDREGHTALLNGYVTHNYFHDPTFHFSVTDAKDFLVYDTNAKLNPVWYGTIYANGSGTMTGVPGFIDVLVDMTTAKNSTFTFVIDDAEEAIDYQFLTFTDKRKEAEMARIREEMQLRDTVPEFVRQFERQHHTQDEEVPTRYRMDLRITATPDAKAIIVMDPAAGDKIRATGEGSLRFTYNSEGEIGLYGTYTIESGSYNFTLQELIVRDFKIRRDSRITFTGDPLNANLDITAAYRVNASLTDLDKSFATDNDLNRNKVPVDALLKITGNMQSPDISFDIDLPTLNQDVARKIRSIVSTADMMNTQMVYLLALNRFYTPDYMNSDGRNNEMASLASATLSTQLGNILGQISDNWSFAPSFRTEKGDFSDMEVDLALSSTLLDNRLIFNGNLGYRDKATSSTTFVGDFDIEYLLNPKGTLRLKAYNHYNDQNYYLRSALTTQGLGIVFKKDFTDFLPGLFGRKKKAEAKKEEPTDSVVPVQNDTIPNN